MSKKNMALETSVCEKCVLPINRDIWEREHCHPSPLILAVQNKHEKCLTAWIKRDLDVNVKHTLFNHTALMVAIMNNFYTGVKLLLKAGCSVNEVNIFGATALLYAVTVGEEELVTILVGAGAVQFATTSTITPLQSATFRGYNKILKILLDAGGNVNEYNAEVDKTLLMIATSVGQEACVKELIEANVDVNFKNRSGATALCFAQTASAAKLLLDVGAEIDVEDINGYTPAIYAACNTHCDLLKTLLESGAHVDHRTSLDKTALLVAALHGCDVCVKLLIKHNADVNVRGQFTSTPILEAASQGHLEVVKTLLSANAQLNLCNNNREKAMSAEIHFGNEECVSLLFVAGEKLQNTDSENVPAIIRDCHKINLKQFCRQSIRGHLLEVNENEHLFQRIPRLGLPSILENYLLYDYSLDDA